MKLRIFQTVDELDAEFHRVEGCLQRVAESAARGEFTAQDLLVLARRGDAVIGVIEGADDVVQMGFAMEFIRYPRFTALNVIALGGICMATNMDLFWEGIKAFGKASGAQCIEASVSPAMARMLGPYGFEATYQQVRSTL